ncbi:hypothetical protein [Glycomyces terrestris]|uniref:Uncharacterized protein n=1 Tax=Glycomyces terrestris TaxID=2493553 RepID=A0A426UUJ9_9ACTN|nr:hypothetical protein [Glycomyces terrestris]RRR97539.1 hypothetical protein EIW28_19295 [Glycomyces terrestris]
MWAAFAERVRVPVAAAAIVTKSTFLALLLPDPVLRADVAAFSVYFALACIVLLGVLIVLESAGRRGQMNARAESDRVAP